MNNLDVDGRPISETEIELTSPGVGYWQGGPKVGEMVVPGQSLGCLWVLGAAYPLTAGAKVAGLVRSRLDGGQSRTPLGFGQSMLVLDSEQMATASVLDVAEEDAVNEDGHFVLRAPMSGRFYPAPGPDQPDFVEVGQEVVEGQPVALLEVMKTFNRVVYGGPGLPSRGVVRAMVPKSGDDVDAQAPMFLIEEVESK